METSKWLSRKLIVTGILYITATIALIFGFAGITFVTWSNFVIFLVGLYFAGNVGDYIANRKK